MAMWITKQRAQTGTVFGFTDKFEGLGMFIDTYKNGRAGTTFPYVMAMDELLTTMIMMARRMMSGDAPYLLPSMRLLTYRHVDYEKLQFRQRED